MHSRIPSRTQSYRSTMQALQSRSGADVSYNPNETRSMFLPNPYALLQAFCLWHGELPLRIWLSRWIMPIQSIQGNWCGEFHPLINNWCKALFYRNEHSHIPPLPLACLPNHYLPSYQWMSLLLRALLTQSVADSPFKQACKGGITRFEGRCFSPHR